MTYYDSYRYISVLYIILFNKTYAKYCSVVAHVQRDSVTLRVHAQMTQ